jgi:tRNA/rRNA methyltransferase
MESETAGNIGAIARAMKNFGVNKLVLISPKADPLAKEAQDRAKYAKDLLSKAAVTTPEAFFRSRRRAYHLLIGTSARVGTSYNLKRNPLTPSQLAAQLGAFPPKSKICILLGREGIGLTNEEIAECDLVVTIPSSPAYPVLNVSQAATVILYELFAERARRNAEKHTLEYIVPPTAREREQLVLLAHTAIDDLDFFTPQKFETQKTVWRKLFGKAVLSRRETFALMGFFRKVKEAQVKKGR